VIIHLDENPYPDKKIPFLIVPFDSVPFELYGTPNAELIGEAQQVRTSIIRGIIDNMAQSNNGQTGFKKGSLDSQNRKKFLEGKNYEFNGNPNDFVFGSYNQLPGTVFDMFSLMGNEIESLTGIKSFSQGITGASLGGTATGVRGAMDSTASRELNIVMNIAENLIKPLIRTWMCYNSEFLDEGQIFRYTNEEPIQVRKDDLKREIDIDIEVSTDTANNSQAQELSFMLQTIGPNEDPAVRREIMADILELRRMPDKAKKLREYQPQPDPMAAKLQELQIAKLEAEIANERAKAGENSVDIELKRAKTQSELAKAENLKEDADTKKLNFLKEESGITREQELENKELDRRRELEKEAIKQSNKNKSNS
jgi:hypothetical protein